ncbi:hypothetical protein V6R21_08610 [Limibacter armeniacum]|uniref:hypothetical protein n=1 Tax=Limibacter armeniacum TaxID=466084 RepID=UPI002FE5B350
MMKQATKECVECGSDYYSNTTEMASLCPECAHYLYGYPKCDHQFENGRCTNCFWNGKSSAYVQKLKKDSNDQ